MKILAIIYLLISCTTFGQTIYKPNDFRTDKILVYMNSYSETIELLNREFDRAATEEVKSERRSALEEVNYFDTAIDQNDRWALGVDPSLFLWINETLTNIIGKSQDVEFIPVKNATLEDFEIEDFKYVLKFSYVMVNGDISDTRMIFFLQNRESGKDIIDYQEPLKANAFRPFIFVTGTNITGQKLAPYYTFIRLYKVKKELAKFFKNI